MDPNEFRTLGHRLIDILADQMASIEDRPLFPKITPRALHDLFDEPLPENGMPLDQIVTELEAKLLPNSAQINHPGYFGLITPTPAPAGILGDLIASSLNQNVGVWSSSPAATTMERRVVRWLTDLIGYDEQAGGNLTSGGMTANFIALKLARDWATQDKAQHDGVTQPLAIYTSEERHVSVDKAADAIGIGRKGLRIIPTDDEFRTDLEKLQASIAEDRHNGIRPIAIVAMGGSTNTGVVDSLTDLRQIADREKLWLHVDAAYGGGMLLSQRHPGVLDGIALADSVTIDPHKWFFAPLDAGAVLVKDGARLTASFGIEPPYLTERSGENRERYNYYVHGFEQSRRFRGLKVWMGLKHFGAAQIGRWVDANIDQILHLDELCRRDPDFAVARKPLLSVICVRYARPNLSEEQLGFLHGDVARRIEEQGRFWFATTFLKGKWYFRICPVNFRTKREHMDELFQLLKDELKRSVE